MICKKSYIIIPFLGMFDKSIGLLQGTLLHFVEEICY